MRTTQYSVPRQLHSVASVSPLMRLNYTSGARRPLPWLQPPTSAGDWEDELEASNRGEKTRRLESILFLSREPINSRRLAQHAGLRDGTQARTLVRHLNKLYDGDQQAFRIEHVAGGYQLLTRPQFATWLRRLKYIPPAWRLSEPAVETLAVVAYRQPVLRAEVETIRGVACGEILRQLMERDLVRIGGRSEELGRPYLYTTTRRFLQIFGLSSLDRLPRAEEMRKPNGFDGCSP